MLIFFFILTLGFAFELGKNALKIDSRQSFSISNRQLNLTAYLFSFSFINIFYDIKKKVI